MLIKFNSLVNKQDINVLTGCFKSFAFEDMAKVAPTGCTRYLSPCHEHTDVLMSIDGARNSLYAYITYVSVRSLH